MPSCSNGLSIHTEVGEPGLIIGFVLKFSECRIRRQSVARQYINTSVLSLSLCQL